MGSLARILVAVVGLSATVGLATELAWAQGFPGRGGPGGPPGYRGDGRPGDGRSFRGEGYRGERGDFRRGFPSRDGGGYRGDGRGGEEGRGYRPEGGGGDVPFRGRGFGPGGPPFGRPGVASSQPEGSSRYEYFFRRLDANGDGRVDPKEVNGPAKMMVEGMARRAGLDPTKSISLTQFHEAMAKRMKQGGFGPGMPFFGTAEQGPSKDDASKTPQEEPLVPGFGLAQDLPPVPGFGVRVAGASPSGSNTSPQGKSKGASSSASDKSRTEYKVRAYAKGIIKKYDKNRSGALEKDEWGQMRTDPSPSDRNNDGVITKEELAARFMKDSKYAGSSSGSSSGSSGASRFASQKSYRFRTAMERLPDGLPDWFAGKDQNADGQVEMHEYASFWSDSTARQFAKYDLDNDGVITPAECLDAASREPESASVTKTETASVPESESDPKQKESSGGGFWWTR